MARKLKIYRGFLPNHENGIHYHFTNVQNYIAEADAECLGAPLVIDFLSWRINGGNVIVSKAAVEDNSTSSFFDVSDVSYIIVYDERTTPPPANYKEYFKAYFVKSWIEQSGNYIFSVEVDYWASYYLFANIVKMVVNRCNKAITNEVGIYDPIAVTKGTIDANIKYFYNDVNYGEGTIPTAQVSLVMLVRLVSSQNIMGTDKVVTDYMVAISLADVLTAVYNETMLDYTSIDLASRVVGGVFGIKFGSLVQTDAKVVKAWLIPSYYVNTQVGAPSIKLVTATPYTGTTHIELDVNKLVVTNEYTYEDLTTKCDPQYKWFLGGWELGIELKNTCESTHRAFISFTIGSNDVSVIVSDGDEQKDITSVFELPILGSSDLQTPLEKIGYWVRFASNATKGLLNVVGGSGGTAQAAAKGGLFALDHLANMTGSKAKATAQNGQGDASANYSCKNSTTKLNNRNQAFVYSPIKLIGFASIENEVEKAHFTGVNYSCMVSSIAAIFAYSYISTAQANLFPYVFLAADAIIDGIPTAARDAIYEKLKRGVYLKKLT